MDRTRCSVGLPLRGADGDGMVLTKDEEFRVGSKKKDLFLRGSTILRTSSSGSMSMGFCDL